jgi:hypothetical protein
LIVDEARLRKLAPLATIDAPEKVKLGSRVAELTGMEGLADFEARLCFGGTTVAEIRPCIAAAEPTISITPSAAAAPSFSGRSNNAFAITVPPAKANYKLANIP